MSKQDDARRKRLRRVLEDAGSEVQVSTVDLRWLLDEVGRLQQGNDRLRRQNRKLRLRSERSGGDDAGIDELAGDDVAGEDNV